LRNLLPAADARRSLQVKVVDDKGRSTRAGAEVRLFAAGTRRLLGLRLVDTGSGYDSQNDAPVHFGLPNGTTSVDIEVIFPQGGKRIPTVMKNVSPSSSQGRIVTVRVK
jgi:ASPIC and UnbV